MKISVETVIKAKLNKGWDAWNNPAGQLRPARGGEGLPRIDSTAGPQGSAA